MPLIRNGYALVASAGVTSVLGLAFWAITARLYPVEQVGLGGVLISALVTIGAAAQLNLTNILNRFVPGTGSRAGKLILLAYAAAAMAGLVLASGFLVVVERLVPALAFLTQTPLLALSFVAAVMVWTIFALQDSALAALRQAVWVPLENAAYAISKIVLVVLFAGAAGSAIGLFAAWTAPLVVIVALVNALIFGRLVPAQSGRAVAGADLSWDRVARFFGWDYAGGLAMAAATGIAPILVLSSSGPEASASYHIAWIITYSLYLVGRSMGISLLSESVADPARLQSLAADAVVHTMVPLVAAAVFVASGAPLLMSLFGPAYVREGASLLTILALSSIPWGLVTVFLAVARARNWLGAIAGAQVATMVLVLGIGATLLPLLGPLGMAIAWLAAHTIVVIGIAVAVWRRGGPDAIMKGGLDVASSFTRLLRTLKEHRQTPELDRDVAEAFDAAITQVGAAERPRWLVVRQLAASGDSSVLLLSRMGYPPAGAVARVARSGPAIASLERSWRCLAAINAAGVAGGELCLPNVLVRQRTESAAIEVDEVVAGEDGRLTLAEAARRPIALSAVARAISALHTRTATPRKIDELWLNRWVDEPLALVLTTFGTIRSTPRREALASFAAEQRAFWLGRTINLGASHGHLGPGSLVFTSDSQTGVVDWLEVQADGPTGFDLCHLALTTRMLISGEEFGPVVRNMLMSPHWTQDELAWLELHTDDGLGWPHDAEAVRALVGLCWLHNVAAHVRDGNRYAADWLWTATNVGWVVRELAGERERR